MKTQAYYDGKHLYPQGLLAFTGPLPAHNRQPTARAAAERIAPRTATLRQRVLDYLRGRGRRGATDREMQAALGMDGNTQRPRRQELQTRGLIRDSHQRRTTDSGRLAIVWEVNPTNLTNPVILDPLPGIT
ncbi:MAG: hypothetical protein PHX05_10375 [Acidobacteriota bacterium]|nr:hypothetical protein [Acidobacteriota bacterium]